ncbi:MAG: glycosyltransferase family 2 protein [Candidatus Electrothrix sp. Rat3]|nr:glycosyltransferase family 2 protein [Candidatus Electrothrix rattekaaiensis]
MALAKHTQHLEFSVVIPVYNTVTALSNLVEQLDAVFSQHLCATYEIILIDDASPHPETWKNIEALCAQYPAVKAARLMRNFGQHAATLCGMQKTSGQTIITMDDDLQHTPSDIPKLLAESSHDIVIAQFKQKEHARFKRTTSSIKGWFDTLILGKPSGLQLSAFRVLKKEVVDGMLSIQTPYPFLPALMFSVSKDVVGVKLEHYARQEGYSGYSLMKLIKLFSCLLVNNSSLLLRFVGIFGCACSFLSMMTASYVIGQKIFNNIPVAGWSSVFVAILFFGGATLFSIGIIGEYLIRILKGVEKKPAYFIRSAYNLEDT